MQDEKLSFLRKYWGYESFRENQSEIVDSILARHDTIGLMATGGGKSLCYQLPALIMEGVCIVVSPLIALMEDQESGLKNKGLNAESIHSGKSKKRQDEILDNCIYGDVKFLFLSPEKLQTEIVLVRLQKMKISFFAIDEAHCISQWGHDFRPSYLKLNIIKEYFANHSLLALTATATDQVVTDIKNFLSFDKQSTLFRSSFARPNISISVVKTSRKLQSLDHYIKSVNGSKIIYARNKRHCHEINSKLRFIGVKSEVYHADISIDIRKKRQESWLLNEIECMVCTSAFGMGIDKADVRMVLHYDLPPSLEEYIQEIGRAGRDGRTSFAIMLYNNYDLQELEFHYEQSIPTTERIRKVYHDLGTFLRLPQGGGMGSTNDFNVEEFLERSGSNKIELRSILQTLEKNEYLKVSSSFFTSDKFRITAGREVLNGFLSSDSDVAKLVQYLLRNYEGLLYGYISVSVEGIKRKYGWNSDQLNNTIALAEKQEIISYKHDDGSQKIQYLSDRLPRKNISLDHKSLRSFYQAKRKRYEKMVDYILAEDCRAKQLLAYFGEVAEEDCGICDYCKGVFDGSYDLQEFNSARHLILSSLSKKPLNVEELLALWPLNKRRKLQAIVEKLTEEQVVVFSNHHFKLPRNS